MILEFGIGLVTPAFGPLKVNLHVLDVTQNIAFGALGYRRAEIFPECPVDQAQVCRSKPLRRESSHEKQARAVLQTFLRPLSQFAERR